MAAMVVGLALLGLLMVRKAPQPAAGPVAPAAPEKAKV